MSELAAPVLRLPHANPRLEPPAQHSRPGQELGLYPGYCPDHRAGNRRQHGNLFGGICSFVASPALPPTFAKRFRFLEKPSYTRLRFLDPSVKGARSGFSEMYASPERCDLAQVPSLNFDGQSFEQLRTTVDAAMEDKCWLVLTGHEVGDGRVKQTVSAKALEKARALEADAAK